MCRSRSGGATAAATSRFRDRQPSTTRRIYSPRSSSSSEEEEVIIRPSRFGRQRQKTQRLSDMMGGRGKSYDEPRDMAGRRLPSLARPRGWGGEGDGRRGVFRGLFSGTAGMPPRSGASARRWMLVGWAGKCCASKLILPYLGYGAKFLYVYIS